MAGITTLLSYAEPFGFIGAFALGALAGVILLSRELIRKGFSVSVEVGRRRS